VLPLDGTRLDKSADRQLRAAAATHCGSSGG
jgi:hypothetical protein